MNYVSVCSGIEAASVAWHGLGWHPLTFAEIAPFPSKVLAHRFPQVPNAGDFTQIVLPPQSPCDLLVGGTPCQAFSVAGLRGGLSDVRGNLALEFCRLADRLRSRWLLWENVPGVLSSNGGRDFGSIVGALAELGYGWAYRVLDAQFVGVPQRRRRVFLVGYLGSWRRAAAVLSERTSLRRDTPPRRKAGQGAARRAPRGTGVCVTGSVTHALTSEGHDASEDGTGRGTPIVFDTTQITSGENRSRPEPGNVCHPLAAQAHPPAIAFHHQQDPISGAVAPALGAHTNGMGVAVGGQGEGDTLTAHHGRNDAESNYVPEGYRVRRLTPRECERLQGFSDDYTLIPGASDAARYRALGNSMAVPCMRWLGERIAVVDAIR